MTFLLVAPHSVVEDEINAPLAKPHRTARHDGALPELRPSTPSRPAASFEKNHTNLLETPSDGTSARTTKEFPPVLRY